MIISQCNVFSMHGNMSTMKTHTANWPFLLPSNVQQELVSRMTQSHYNDGEYIYRAGDTSKTCFQILKGRVRLRVFSRSGKEATYIIYGPGDCFGWLSAIDGEPRAQDSIAFGEATVNKLEFNDLERLRDRYPEIDRALARHCAWRLRELFSIYEVGNFSSLNRRLAVQIGLLLDFAGPNRDGKPPEELEITQETLATAVCATRQAIGKVLKAWSDEGIIEYRYGRFRILDRTRLTAIAEND